MIEACELAAKAGIAPVVACLLVGLLLGIPAGFVLGLRRQWSELRAEVDRALRCHPEGWR